MRRIAFVCLLLLFSRSAFGQDNDPEYSQQQLKQDLAFLKRQVLNAHANPYTELSKDEYEKLFDSIDAQITGPATATTFFRLIKPVVAYLSDEHAQISFKTTAQATIYQGKNIFLPVSLSKKGKVYIINKVLSDDTSLKPGDVITYVDGVPVAKQVTECATYTTGFPNQRMRKAAEQFGYLYSISNQMQASVFNVKTGAGKTIPVKGVDFNTWQNYVVATSGYAEPYTQMISYTRYKDAGYIDARSFSTHSDAQFDSLRNVIDKIFKQIKTDGVKYLFIDVSKNGGGNSAVGDVMIGHFYDKPYNGYQCNWRRSDEYQAQMRAWGSTDDNYNKTTVGDILHFDSYKITPPADNPYRFKGKVFIVIGDGTFSSAIMFATIIKDDHIAQLIGNAPADGHPDHYGEMYSINLPNTPITARFGVKEWIRPAGKQPDNVLHPDKVINLNIMHTPQQIINSVVK